MKIHVTLDLNEFLHDVDEPLNELILEALSEDIMKVVKRQPEYKTYIKLKTQELLDKVDV